jgi:hypothetical protein
MNSLRSLIPVGLLSLLVSGVAGCGKKEEPPKPDPAATAAATGTGKSKLNVRTPMSPLSKIDPAVMKDYRLDVCYYGTFALRQARESYLASLGKDEPSEKKIPSFGGPAAGTAAAASGSAKAGAPAKPPTPAPAATPAPKTSGTAQAGKPGASGSAAAVAPPAERKYDVFMRAPYERNARICTLAATLKEPAMAGVDEALAAYAPFANDLAKDIAAAQTYYKNEEFKKDSFAKGKELHKKLVEGFGKLDDLHDKFGNALIAWRKDHPADASKAEEGEKLARQAIDDARAVFLLAITKKIDGDGYKQGVEKVEKSAAALKAYADGHPSDQWSKIMQNPFDTFLKTVKDAKPTADKGLDAEGQLALVNAMTSIIEGRQRSISRSNIAKNQPAAPHGGAPAPSGAPQAPQAPHAPMPTPEHP